MPRRSTLCGCSVGYRSGQTGRAVNALALPSQVRILPPPSALKEPRARLCRPALVAQLVEHFHGKEGVSGSSPDEGLAYDRDVGADVDPALTDAAREFLDEPEARDHPEDLYRRLTTEAPVLPIGDGRWVISGYKEIRTALRAPEVGTSVVGTPWASQAAGGRDDALGVLARAFINEVDGEAHERISQSIQVPWITDPPGLVDQWAAEVVDEGLDKADSDGKLDLVSAIFEPLPAVVVARACAPRDGRPATAADVGGRPRGASDAPSMQPPGWAEAAVQAATELTPWTEQLIADRRTAGGDDFLSQIIQRAGDTLSSDELVAIVAGIVTGGQEGTTASITSATAQFLAMDGMLDRLRSEPDLVDPAIWEAQRLDGAHRFTLRYSQADAGPRRPPRPAGRAAHGLPGRGQPRPGRVARPRHVRPRAPGARSPPRPRAQPGPQLRRASLWRHEPRSRDDERRHAPAAGADPSIEAISDPTRPAPHRQPAVRDHRRATRCGHHSPERAGPARSWWRGRAARGGGRRPVRRSALPSRR